jgi:hypothetical protein
MICSLFWDVTQRRFDIQLSTYRESLSVPTSRVKKSKDCLTFEDATDRLSRNVGKYQSILSNTPEELRFKHIHCLGYQERVKGLQVHKKYVYCKNKYNCMYTYFWWGVVRIPPSGRVELRIGLWNGFHTWVCAVLGDLHFRMHKGT